MSMWKVFYSQIALIIYHVHGQRDRKNQAYLFVYAVVHVQNL